ncbi:MAG: porin family protein [Bacteroidota bacterium]
MKQLLFLVFTFLILYTPLRAQEVEYGIKAGINLADVYSNNYLVPLDGSEGFRQRFPAKIVTKRQLGGWMNIPLNNKFSVQPELLFTQKAWLPGDIEDAITLHFNYLSLPLVMNYHLKNWRIAAGPEISFLINQYYSEEVFLFGDKSPFVKEQKLELGILAGASYHFQRWQVGLRYNLDITPFVSFEFVDVNGDPVDGDDLNHYHHGLQISLGYRL